MVRSRAKYQRSLTVLKVQEIPSGYDASQYVTERVMITARDVTGYAESVLRAERDKQRHRMNLLELRAPQPGVILA